MLNFFIGAIVGFFLDKFFDFIWKKLNNYWFVVRKEKNAKKYSEVVASEDFIEFQTKVLMAYYGKENCLYLFERYYPAFILYGDTTLSDPFNELNEPDNLCLTDKNYPFRESHYYKKYKGVISATIKRPLMQGYMLESFSYNNEGKIKGLSAWVGTYEENVYTSHILEYEIYRMYIKHRKNLSKADIESVAQKEMPIRNKIHENRPIANVLRSGCARASLLGVQMLILFKDKNGSYKVLVIKRSQDVAAKPGFIQFVPSGGFEVFENSDTHNKRELLENFSVKNALFREYVEELFGIEEFEFGQGGETINKVSNYSQVKEIQNMIDNGTAKFVFLGSAVDLTGLRHELSFALVINDDRYCENIFKSNSESKKIERYSFEDIEGIEEKHKINPTSAALWKLFTESELYNEITLPQKNN